MRKKHMLSAVLVVCLLCSLAACTSSPAPTQVTATPTVSPSPTATTLPSGTLLYQANWSRGLSGWQNTRGWKVVQGQLEIVTGGTAMLTIPYRPTVPNYMIEIHLQIVSLTQGNGGYFTIFGTPQPGKDGYGASVSSLKGSKPREFGSHPQAAVEINPSSSMTAGSGGIPIDYEPGFGWHTYSVETLDNEARLLDEGVSIGYASSNKTDFLSNGPLGVISAEVILRISSIRIVSV